MADDDDESAQLGQREADSLSGDYLSTQDLESIVLDSIQDHLDMHPLLPVTNSSSREDEDAGWDTPEDLTPDNSGVIPRIITQEVFPERDRAIADERELLPTPLEAMFPTSFMEDTDFTIEKVLGETTANILMEAEVAAFKFADEFKQLEAGFDSETDLTEPHSILNCRVCQLFVRTVDRLLDKSDELMDHYLPLTEEEIGNLKKAVEELDDSLADHQVQMCLDRINNLSSKLRQRAYMMALSKLRMARRNTQESLCQLHQTINLIGQVQHEDHPQNHQSFRKLSAITVEWTQRHERHTIQAPFGELKEATSRNEEVGVPLAESTRIGIGVRLAESTRTGFEAPLAESTRIEIGAPLAESTRIEIGVPLAESTRIEIGAPLAHSTEVEEIGLPLAQSSSIERTAEISRPEPTPPPAEATPEKAMTPPAEKSCPEERTTPPPEISCPGNVSLPPLQSSRPEKVAKPATSLPEHILRDIANITVTSPGCDKQDQLASETPPSEEEAEMLPSEMEEKALEMSRSLAHNLHGTYENLLVHLKDLPEELQKKLYQTCRDMADLRSDFDSAHRFGDLSRGLLNKSFEVMAEAQCSMDELMEYALQSPKALLWLKDHLSNLEDPEQEQVLREDVPLPAEGEEELASAFGKKGQDRDLLKIQEAHDPQGCKEEELQATEKQADRPAEKPAWNLMEMLQGVLPKAPDVEDVPGQADDVLPPEEQEVGERNILEIQRAHDPQGCEENTLPGKEELAGPPAGERQSEDILEIQRAYDPQGCKEEELQATEKQADRPAGEPVWNLMEMLQGVLPKAPGVEDFPGQADDVLPPEEQEVGERNILEIQRGQDPRGCDEEPPPGQQEMVPPSSEWELEGLLKIEEAYDPQACDEGPPPRKEEEVVAPSEWKIVKFLQAYVPKIHTDGAASPEKTVEVAQEETRDPDTLKTQKAYDPKGCDEDGPSENDGADEEGCLPSEQDGRDILKIQKAYDPRGCEDETLPVREKTEVSASAEQQEWRFLKILQSYIPRSRNNGASPAAEAKAPPAPTIGEGKEGASEGVIPPAGNQEPPRWDILKIQEAQDPKGCEEENA